MPFGVELPTNIGESGASPSAPAPDTSTSNNPAPGDTVDAVTGTEISTKAPRNETPSKASLTDLDKLERFRFEGREWSRSDLKRAYLRHEDYTRKTQELAETRKFTDNFAHDLRAVIDNPARLEELRRIYPREFVERAEEILSHRQGAKPPEGQSPSTPPDAVREELTAIKRDLSTWKEEKEKVELEQIQSWLDNQFETLAKKYTHANAEVITARAEVAARQGHKITPEVLEKLFKANDSEIKGKWEALYKDKVNKQLTAGKEARDLGPGGGTPSGAPKNPRTFKEAREMMIEDLKAGRSR